ncbi:disease resistance protein Pik-2-like [Phragmites australis]|uniref:disease resistance protein Pik-2-like n=1 Tax=Phragmites australis TaxID=29695 RepID=UPI002D795794|nr:disease resistance protein Pik-2-like [Phragmites australis]
MEMLASASEGVMGALAEKLKALLGNEYALQAGVRGDISFVQSELRSTHAFLLDHASIGGDTCHGQTLRLHSHGSPQDRRANGRPPSRALEVSDRRKRCDLSVPSDAPSPAVELPPTAYAETTNLVGIDGPRDEVIGKLMSVRTNHASGRRRVASMVRFAGVGKSTLAMAVYESLECQFQCRAFVTVSRKFDIRRVLKDMLQQVMISTGSSSMLDPAMSGVETWEVRQFADKLRDNLQDKR